MQPIQTPSTIEFVTNSPNDTQDLGRDIGSRAQPGDVLLLIGDLGAGKTTLTQGILWGLGGEEYARSPTFVLVSEYEARLKLYHIDLYRIDKLSELDDLGIVEILDGPGVTVIEWADRALEAFPSERLEVRFIRAQNDSRILKLSSTSPRYDHYFERNQPT